MTSQFLMMCSSSRTAQGLHTTNRLIATFQTRVGSLTEVHSYDRASARGPTWEITVEYLNAKFVIGDPNLVTRAESTSGSIFMVGSQFGYQSFTTRVRTHNSAVMATKWLSSTLLNCKMSSAVGASKNLLVTAGGQMQVGSVSFAMSYDVVSLRSFTYHSSLTNALFPGGRIHTVSGSNFGNVGMSLGARFSTAGENSRWTSDTSLATKVAPFHSHVGKITPVVITAGEQVGSQTKVMSYDGASVSTSHSTNVKAVKSLPLIALSGINTGAAATSTRASLGHSACTVSDWVSSSSLLTKPSDGISNWKAIVISIAVLSATRSYAVTYDTPEQSTFKPSNGATAVLSSTLLFASNLGKSDYTPRLSIGGSAVQATAWRSDTTMVIKPNKGIMPTKFQAGVAVTVAVYCPKYVDEFGLVFNYVSDCKVTDVQVATRSRAFSYDISSVSSTARTSFEVAVQRASLASRADLMSTAGTNFATEAYTNRIRLGGTAVQASFWISDSAMSARFSDGLRGSRHVILTVGSAGTTSRLFTYFAPAIMMPFEDGVDLSYNHSYHQSYKSNGPGTGAAILYVHGALMGHAAYSQMAKISYSSVGASRWTSDSSISCLSGQGGGGGPMIVLTSGESLRSSSEVWSYDAPLVSMIIDSSVPGPLNDRIVTLSGSNYANIDLTQQGRFGPSSCELSKWIATTSLTCKRPKGPPSAIERDSIVVTVIRQYNTFTLTFSFDTHSVQGALLGNSPATGILCVPEICAISSVCGLIAFRHSNLP